MPAVRQLPKLLLRGSVSSVTMKSLTEEQKKKVEEIIELILSVPEVKKTRDQVSRKLADTIGGDYREDKAVADQESRITIWRAVVDLLYHRKYSYHCGNCGATSYITQTNKNYTYDQKYDRCKVCQCVQIESIGDVKSIVKNGKKVALEPGMYVTHQEFQDCYEHLTDDDEAPKSCSPIVVEAGELKHNQDDANKIIYDEEETTRFFREFLWNNFKQILKENGRKQHQAEPSEFIDRADIVVVEEILLMLKKLRVAHTYHRESQPERGKFVIKVQMLQAPIEASAELAKLLFKARSYEVGYTLNEGEILIHETLAAPEIVASIPKPEYVSQMNELSPSDEEDNRLSKIDYKTVKGTKMDLEDHIGNAESSDWINTVRDALPDGLTRRVFDLYCQHGDDWEVFSSDENFGDGSPKISHMVEYFGVGRNQIVDSKECIELNTFRFLSPEQRKKVTI